MTGIKKNWQLWALVILALCGLMLGYHYITETPFYQYLETVNPDNHRH